jgi:hypothetical protein
MNRRYKTNFKMFTVLAMAGLALAGSAQAECRRKINLTSAMQGDFSGTAEVREQRSQQKFKLSMDARVADGTTYIVSANGFAVGTITIRLGDGELELSNSNGKQMPQGTNPACSVASVAVLDSAGRTILSGSF